MIITIDGPAASGKSTIGRMVADKLNLFYLYSGLLYRACAYILHEQKKLKQYSEKATISREQAEVDLKLHLLEYIYTSDHGIVIMYNNQQITEHLGKPEISSYASIISTQSSIRTLLTNMQRDLAQNKNIVADGRDCGTHVFPDAEIKFFLTASQDIRAIRLQKALASEGKKYTHDEVLKQIADRDFRDKSRAIAPLEPAHDALIVDNSLLTIAETFELFLNVIAQSNIN